jgi:predicted ATPase
LREKETLLIFDNFEHVMEGAGIVQDILGAAPGVKVVATSRERLKLAGEAVLELGGMGYPEEGGGEEKAEEYTAVQLFVQSARRARTEFKLERGERGQVARICRLVRGMPLGIELAAAWVTTYSCEDIAREIERNLDFVAAQQKDRPERHLSLRAVFEYSWQLLSARESDALVRLSVFRGGFRREAAEKAAGVSLLAIAALVDKSLIQRHATGRYEIHPVLRQYAEEKSAGRGDENAEIRGKHCEYFARFLSARLPDIISARQQDVATEISEEIENVRSAWRWLIDHQRLADLDLALGCLAEFYEMRSWYHEGEEAFREAAQMLERLLSQDGAAKAPIELLYGKVLRRSGWFYFRLSKYDTAAEVLRTSLAILQKHDAKLEEGTCHYYLGAVEHLQGRYADAQRELETSLKLAEEVGNALGTGASLTGLGIICTSQGNWEQAYQFYQKSLQVSRSLGDVWGIANALNNLGWAAAALGQVTEARGLYRESLVLCKQLGNRYGMANCLNNLGYLASGKGEQGQAKRFYQESLVHFREIGDRSGVANVLANLGAAHLELAEEEEAERLYYQSLETALEVQALPVAIEAIVGIAKLMIRRGNIERAIVLLGAAQAQEATDMQVKERAGRLLAKLEAEIPAEAFAAALQRGSTSTMDSVIAEVLKASNRQGP